MKKEKIIKFRVTESEEKELQTKADEYGMSLSKYCRYSLFEGEKPQRTFYERTLPYMIRIGGLSDTALCFLDKQGTCSKEDIDGAKTCIEGIRTGVRKAWGI